MLKMSHQICSAVTNLDIFQQPNTHYQYFICLQLSPPYNARQIAVFQQISCKSLLLGYASYNTKHSSTMLPCLTTQGMNVISTNNERYKEKNLCQLPQNTAKDVCLQKAVNTGFEVLNTTKAAQQRPVNKVQNTKVINQNPGCVYMEHAMFNIWLYVSSNL